MTALTSLQEKGCQGHRLRAQPAGCCLSPLYFPSPLAHPPFRALLLNTFQLLGQLINVHSPHCDWNQRSSGAWVQPVQRVHSTILQCCCPATGHCQGKRVRTKKGSSKELLLDQRNASSTEMFDELEPNKNVTATSS